MYILFLVGHCFQLKIKTDKGVMGSFSFMLLCCFLPRHRLIPPTSNRKGWRRLKTRIGCQWSRARIWWGKIWSSNRKPLRTKQQLRTANTTWKTIVTVSGMLYNLVCLFFWFYLIHFYASTSTSHPLNPGPGTSPKRKEVLRWKWRCSLPTPSTWCRVRRVKTVSRSRRRTQIYMQPLCIPSLLVWVWKPN